MPDEPRIHSLRLTDRDVGAIERSLRTRHGVLGLTGNLRPTEQMKAEADQLAHTAAIVQEHTRTNCPCFPAPVPPPAPAPVPVQERRVV